MICKYILLVTFLNEPELIFFCTQLNGFKHFYQRLIILFNITHLVANSELFYSTLFLHLHTVKRFQELVHIPKNSIKHQSFVYTQLNGQTALFLTIQFNKSNLFAYRLNVKQFFFTHR